LAGQEKDRNEIIGQLAVGLMLSLMVWGGPTFVLVIVALVAPQDSRFLCIALVLMTLGTRSLMLAACKKQFFDHPDSPDSA
jgi:hypothetical protein